VDYFENFVSWQKGAVFCMERTAEGWLARERAGSKAESSAVVTGASN